MKTLLALILILGTTLANAQVLPQPRALMPFTLQNTHGQTFTQKELTGQWSLLFFGFTRCPGICPTSMTELKRMYEKLQTEHAAIMPQVIFVSVDPEYDTLQGIQKYVTAFNPAFKGVTGDKHQLDTLTTQLGILYMKTAAPGQKNPDNYTIDHSGSILLIDPNGELYAIFTMPHHGNKLASDFIAITTRG